MNAAAIEPLPEEPGERRVVFGLLGSPNAGKTTLFNALTGLRARVGNYPGVTVERREAELPIDDERTAILIDLPGTYGLTPISADEAVVDDVLAGRIEARDPVYRLAIGGNLVAHCGSQNRVVLDQQDAHVGPDPFPMTLHDLSG